jgi:hypothetical protein
MGPFDAMIDCVSGATPPLAYTPIEYVQMGRFRCGAEPFEGPEAGPAGGRLEED